VPHQGYLFDRGVASATGITASVPVSLALVEAIGGRDKAQALSDELGVDAWGPAHDSSRFQLDGRRRWNFVVNKATAWWRHERWSANVTNGSDNIALALAADAWSRTGRVSVVAASTSNGVMLRSGLKLVTKPAADGSPRLPLADGVKPMQQLERSLCEIHQRYGDSRHE
jgi:hypothetical protein